MDAAAWDAKYERAELIWGSPPNDMVVEFCTSLPRGRALDVACGEGRNALWLATRGWNVDAVDFSSVALTKAVRIAGTATASIRERVRWVHADVTTLTPERSYDLAVVAYLHLPPNARREALNIAIDGLKHEGILVIVGHHSANLENGVGGPQDPEILYSPDDLVADIADRMHILVAEDRVRHVGDSTAIDALVVGRVTRE
ncbi:class I SAM-dependent methyltransferase [Rhodococcus sp. BP-349]|uniref:class I SAM-dependent methyltransferase n=1 Tax=unclassified Rhodococcus (in: high G+C Gram-positive bacteria) TaxID=192944 RepID=UPI001C9A7FCF|nr:MULTISPECIES: class I SAM-dependent methyltransferase [unclassified Rhodococcus (in: high G+C Gram-positive bacteria)]MBY6539486.1 class I SAM-dependent methyltransferase [Rhodococcus sp. BP-363]MBY6544186.1 class I SAM-dependent methyltransferase [Rhodococcus sp. BP-369]MBY6563416.1 class I SAM-dependent methyltransferase [Rhodococcus sp. BP-370]MBY6577708.1 class I SAM-dependent methyltransferase [Rhodococcus sp. BP-364]MBY6587009.1 class I SAM-dependent methyltransferase [Rhodococcus sp.